MASEGNLSISDLDLDGKHKVDVLCEGKPQQSFKFVLLTSKAGTSVFIINDLYKRAQLWEKERSPWCKCKPSQNPH